LTILQSSVTSYSEQLLTLTHGSKNLQDKYSLSGVSHQLDILLHAVKNLLFIISMELQHANEGHISKKGTIEFIGHLETEYKLASISFESLKLISLQTRGSAIEKEAETAMNFVDQYGKIIKGFSKSLTSYATNTSSAKE